MVWEPPPPVYGPPASSYSYSYCYSYSYSYCYCYCYCYSYCYSYSYHAAFAEISLDPPSNTCRLAHPALDCIQPSPGPCGRSQLVHRRNFEVGAGIDNLHAGEDFVAPYSTAVKGLGLGLGLCYHLYARKDQAVAG